MVKKKSSGRAESSRFQLLLGIPEIRDLFNRWKEGRAGNRGSARKGVTGVSGWRNARHVLALSFAVGEIAPIVVVNWVAELKQRLSQ